ncbi:MAG: hypothetical protein M4D80_20460 [Myxococcota bacterium]|nr:hypothetical protein [Myxococcota bacterium]
MRSKPESPTSPENGDAPDLPKPDAEAAAPKEKRKGGNVEVKLEVSRQRPIGWTVFGLIVGALLIWKLGTVGKWVGVGLMIVGAFRAWQLIQSYMHPPGTIKVTESEVTLPRGLCLPRPLKVKPSDVTAVYFLRRSVPWNRSAPVLVVELGEKALAYPRDWFASEADQRHIVHALLRGRGGLPAPTVDPAADHRRDQATS